MWRPPRVLVLDVEMFPTLGYVWRWWETGLIGAPVHDELVVSFAYRWLHQKKTHVFALPDFKEYKRSPHTNRSLTRKMYSIIRKADVLIAHNGKKFDLKKINTAVVINKLKPTPPLTMIDTLIVAKTYFSFGSNSLGNICRQLGIGKKTPVTFDLWRRCMAGEAAAWDEMRRYNVHDVDGLLLPLYHVFAPWIQNHPRMTPPHIALRACTLCGGTDLKREGHRYTKTGKVVRYTCRKDGKWLTGRFIKKQFRIS